MLSIRRKISIIILVIAVFFGTLLYFYSRIYLSYGTNSEPKTVVIEKGDNALVVGEKLSKEDIVSGKYYLAFYLWRKGDLHGVVAGTYEFSPGLKIPEVARIITGGQVASTRIKLTFPEGWTNKDMAERLDANGYSGNDFLALANDPTQELKDKFVFLRGIPKGKSLEGYLFPDTYYFAKDATSQEIIEKMLKNFSAKISQTMIDEISSQDKTLYDVITMASIVEGEVSSDDDRRVVAGLFWNRLEIGQALQSDATLEYVLKTKKFQHSLAETKIDSPYNTYQNKGLPPGPVCNPGLSAIAAAIHPQDTQYNYFLSDPKTGMTVFSRTFEEHVANKQKYGL